MHTIRLIREVTAPSGRGPGNGQYALQRALRRRAPAWLKIGGPLEDNDIPWFWSWEDRPAAVMCAHVGRPFVAGPNVLFDDSRRPCRSPGERELCNAVSCRLLFTESRWYADLIRQNLGPRNRAPIVLWPYPIDPKPDGPVEPAQHDLLIYVKNGRFGRLLEHLHDHYARCLVVRYGRYRRRRFWEAARRAGCCCYLADDDRGPLALAEILLCGCPAVGLPSGAPFIRQGRTGILLERLTVSDCIEAIEDCLEFDRRHVAALAAEQFDTGRIVDTVVRALNQARMV